MDTLRGSWDFGSHGSVSSHDDAAAETTHIDQIDREPPPRPVGQDERRMQVRAYNHWAGLLDDRNFPSISDLDIERLEDFGPFSVLLEFSDGIEDPQIKFLGAELREECCLDKGATKLSDVPARSVLSRITDHYLQILANQAPIGFEAEFVNQAEKDVMYRGILLPYSSDDQTIDFVLGVINWKELAGAEQTEELMLEIDQALAEQPATASPREAEMMADWADGPASDAEDADEEDDILELGVADGTSVFSGDYEADFGDEYGGDDDLEEDGIPGPSFGSLTGGGFTKSPQSEGGTSEPLDLTQEAEDTDLPATDLPMPEEYVAPTAEPHFTLLSEEPQEGASPESAEPDETPGAVKEAPPTESELPSELDTPLAADDSMQDEATVEDEASIEDAVSTPAASDDATLYDTLSLARERAHDAKTCEDRSRKALYDAISQAYDFALASENAPLEYAEILEDCGLVAQERAPMTPVAKLVFGMDYDKTRLTEYAAALAYAKRQTVGAGELSDYISAFDGGLKGIVAAERRLRRDEAGKPAKPSIMQRLAKKLRAIAPIAIENLDSEGEEFAIVMIRRNADGGVELLGEVPSDAALISKAAKRLVS